MVCSFGITANILNIIVLTRKNMKSATNSILTGLAVFDELTMLAYFPFALLQNDCSNDLVNSSSSGSGFSSLSSSEIWCVDIATEYTTMSTLNFWSQSLLFKLIPCCLLTILSICLIKTMREADEKRIRLLGRREGSNMAEKNKISLLGKSGRSNMAGENRSSSSIGGGNSKMAAIVSEGSNMAGKNKMAIGFEVVENFNTAGGGCMMVGRSGSGMVESLKDEEANSKKNMSTNNTATKRNTNRTTKMLVAVVVLFLITEFPQGVLMLFSGFSETFKDEVYLPLGDFIDIIALINNAINFILYCTMSKQFRDTFMSATSSQAPSRMEKGQKSNLTQKRVGSSSSRVEEPSLTLNSDNALKPVKIVPKVYDPKRAVTLDYRADKKDHCCEFYIHNTEPTVIKYEISRDLEECLHCRPTKGIIKSSEIAVIVAALRSKWIQKQDWSVFDTNGYLGKMIVNLKIPISSPDLEIFQNGMTRVKVEKHNLIILLSQKSVDVLTKIEEPSAESYNKQKALEYVKQLQLKEKATKALTYLRLSILIEYPKWVAAAVVGFLALYFDLCFDKN
ncbi:hypothetical protein HELRODRAFT_194885 [Helobdella robusta]|uniref:G-protein coupled receptors family 1 profile domain-containing protein n=1 Tax=Helobdella robusta TaxID=6412 RepID=T1FWJ2_HELRO|nr:hypothetical protein HELRODRAFT_194885 [Helobdella robusta]ESO11149.1 hypothetical protein HELRODRAFT_194885 [Helobdella robusta]